MRHPAGTGPARLAQAREALRKAKADPLRRVVADRQVDTVAYLPWLDSSCGKQVPWHKGEQAVTADARPRGETVAVEAGKPAALLSEIAELQRENARLRCRIEHGHSSATAASSTIVAALQEENGSLRETISQLERQLEDAVHRVRVQCDSTAVTQARVMAKLQQIETTIESA